MLLYNIQYMAIDTAKKVLKALAARKAKKNQKKVTNESKVGIKKLDQDPREIERRLMSKINNSE